MTVIDVPSHEDFLNLGSDYLQLAWDQVATLLTDLEDSFEEYDQETKDEYWAASRRILLTALTIAQQGVELTLKGYIAEISPYLLVQNQVQSPTSKASGSPTRHGIPFATFKTIDSQDLLKMMALWTDKELSKSFQGRFDELRNSRNQIMHSVGERVSIEPAELVEVILEMHSELFPSNRLAVGPVRVSGEAAGSAFGG